MSNIEKSGIPESRGPAKRYLELYKLALANGETGKLTGKELRLIEQELEARKSGNTVRADQIREVRKKMRADEEQERAEYFEILRSKIGKHEKG